MILTSLTMVGMYRIVTVVTSDVGVPSTYLVLNENDYISVKMSLKSVTWGPINNMPALVKIMVWRRPGDKPLSEQMIVSLSMHICITQPQ